MNDQTRTHARPETIARFHDARDRLSLRLRRPPTLREIADFLGCSRERVRQVLCATSSEVPETTSQRDEKILTLQRKGMNCGRIAGVLDIDRRTVERTCRLNGVSSTRPYRKWSFDEHVQVLRLRLDGASLAKIAAKMDTTSSTVGVILYRLRGSSEYAAQVRVKAGAA
jgi:DNA-binding CsgD family transcriptional regulator